VFVCTVTSAGRGVTHVRVDGAAVAAGSLTFKTYGGLGPVFGDAKGEVSDLKL
jgi:hypothetical protein